MIKNGVITGIALFVTLFFLSNSLLSLFSNIVGMQVAPSSIWSTLAYQTGLGVLYASCPAISVLVVYNNFKLFNWKPTYGSVLLAALLAITSLFSWRLLALRHLIGNTQTSTEFPKTVWLDMHFLNQAIWNSNIAILSVIIAVIFFKRFRTNKTSRIGAPSNT